MTMDDPTGPAPGPDLISEDLLPLVKPDLQPGERLLWAARAGLAARSASDEGSGSAWVWAAGFATIGLACLLAFPRLVRPAGGDGFDSWLFIIGVVALIVGFLIVVGIVGSKIDARSQRNATDGQVYALTDRRAIIYVPDAKSGAVTVHAIPRGTIKVNKVHRVQYPDGSGDVVLRGGSSTLSGFRGVEDVRRVEELVRRFLVAPTPDSSPLDET